MKKLCSCKKNLINITEVRCSECEKKFIEDRKKFAKKYKSVNEKFYKTNKWKKLSKFVRDKYHGLDLFELKVNGKAVDSKVVHHIISIEDDFNKRYDINNLIPLSISSHMKIEKIYLTKNKEKMQKLLLELVKNGI